MAEVIAFFRARKGRAFGFRFRDWGDFEATDQQCQPVNATVFQLVKRYPSGPVVEIRTITRPVVGSVVVRVSGNIVSPTIDHATGRLTFGSAPAATPVATFRFDVPVRFDTDQLQVISRAYNLQNVQSIPLVDIRA